MLLQHQNNCHVDAEVFSITATGGRVRYQVLAVQDSDRVTMKHRVISTGMSYSAYRMAATVVNIDS